MRRLVPRLSIACIAIGCGPDVPSLHSLGDGGEGLLDCADEEPT